MSDPTPSSRLRTVRAVAELRSLLAPSRRAGKTVGLVPTMGALHEGHLSLIRRARACCDLVVVTLFVNPSQFNQTSDLERYPRSERRDAEHAEAAGADILFAPSVEEMYPPAFSTAVEVLGVTERLEGAARGREHFRGVATIVTKLLCAALPDVAYFGQKDAQQLVVIRRLVEDLNLPVRIESVPTVRDSDGLALSSRNGLLTPAERERALALPTALRAAQERAAKGENSAAALVGAAERKLAARGVQPEYVALVDPDSFEQLERLTAAGLLALAAWIGDVRLIDNVVVQPGHAPARAELIAGGANPTPTSLPGGSTP
jgi:pantoate--beta-alanine ligase